MNPCVRICAPASISSPHTWSSCNRATMDRKRWQHFERSERLSLKGVSTAYTKTKGEYCMAPQTYETTPTRFVEANGIRYAYRSLEKESGVPLVFLQHFRGTLDNWDPAVVNGLAKDRPVFLFDSAGIASSGGQTPDNVAEMAHHARAVIQALGLRQVDLLGFSLGGFVAQQVTLDRPDLVRRVILAGTGPQGGEGFDKFSPGGQAVGALEKARPGDMVLYFFLLDGTKAAYRTGHLRCATTSEEDDV